MALRDLRQLDFELAYLCLLTQSGLKPLSRWEKEIREADLEVLADAVSTVTCLKRRPARGRSVTETVLSNLPRRADLYRRRFEGAALRNSAELTRLEGHLFGYPSCCVEHFVREPYAANQLHHEDQRILFHWACPSCKVTPGLLREYRQVHEECRRIFNLRRGKSAPYAGSVVTRHRYRGARTVASLLLVAYGAGIAAAAPDPHWLVQEDDLDHDQLSFAEEVLLGTAWERADTDQDGILDGPQTALRLLELVQRPPNGVTVEHHLLRGMEICTVCGARVNMGGVNIRHLRRVLSIELPYIALHYLQHGGLAYDGDLHTGRVDLQALERILVPMDPAHVLVGEAEDADMDGLLDGEETTLGTNPSIADSDGDTLADGPQLAEELIPLIGGLARSPAADQPYLLELQMDGIERCEVCGIGLNMGHVDIVNPLEDVTVSIPFVALHTLGHGGFIYQGSAHVGRTLPVLLRTVLEARGQAHWLPIPNDMDGDGLTDDEERRLGLDPLNPDEDGDASPDGRSLAAELHALVQALPDRPRQTEPFVEHHLTFGVDPCLTCAEAINMGFVRIIDPIENRSVDVPYYCLHFMCRGSFSSDRPSLYPRVDPCELAQILGFEVVGTRPVSGNFSFWNAPNPFHAGGSTTIVLALPRSAERVRLEIFDLRGRLIRQLYEGDVVEQVLHLRWGGRDDRGRSMATGVYLCKAVIENATVTRKIVLAP